MKVILSLQGKLTIDSDTPAIPPWAVQWSDCNVRSLGPQEEYFVNSFLDFFLFFSSINLPLMNGGKLISLLTFFLSG